MRSTSFAVLVVAVACGCSKGPAIGDRKLTVPDGCTSEVTSTTGRLSCKSSQTELAWLRIEAGDGEAEMDRDEGIIRDAFHDAFPHAKMETDKPECKVGGAAARCRRLRVQRRNLAYLAVAPVGDKRFFVECAFDDAGVAQPPVCNGLFEVATP
jgi:hypothetical protein